MSNRRVDRVLCNIAAYTKIIIIAVFFQQLAALLFHLISGLPCADQHLTHTAHGLTVRGYDRKGTHVVQNIFCRNGFAADTTFCERNILWDGFV